MGESVSTWVNRLVSTGVPYKSYLSLDDYVLFVTAATRPPRTSSSAKPCSEEGGDNNNIDININL
eukprot:1192128-Prorocentrum_minimum.AAC.2